MTQSDPSGTTQGYACIQASQSATPGGGDQGFGGTFAAVGHGQQDEGGLGHDPGGTLLERITGHIPHHLKFIEEKLAVIGAMARS